MNAFIMNCSPVRNGATAGIIEIISECLKNRCTVRTACIDDFSFAFCKGCRRCHLTAKCVQKDDIDIIIKHYEWADIIISVSPSYWADVPGQFKAFIDRCTPWCNTHKPHDSISKGKKGYSIALRTGSSLKECKRIVDTIEHFYGHMEIECCESLCLTSVENTDALPSVRQNIIEFCKNI